MDANSYTLLLNESDAAKSLGLTPRTMQAWRWEGKGPAFVRVSSRCVRYRVTDLESWAADLVQTSTSDTPTRRELNTRGEAA